MGGAGKYPSFPFYAEDWLSSKSVTLMNAEQEGAYIRLLAYAWQEDDCGLTDDEEELKALSRLGDNFEHLFPRVRALFEHIDGRLFNTRLCAERDRLVSTSKKRAMAGQASGKARRDKKLQERTSVPVCSNKTGTKTNTTVTVPLSVTATVTEDQDPLISPASPNPESWENNQEPLPLPERSTPLNRKDPALEAFEQFWAAWPKTHRAGKGYALECWRKKSKKPNNGTKGMPPLNAVLEALDLHKKSVRFTVPDKDGKLCIPNPSTWINQGRWDDTYEPAEEKKRLVPKQELDPNDPFSR